MDEDEFDDQRKCDSLKNDTYIKMMELIGAEPNLPNTLAPLHWYLLKHGVSFPLFQDFSTFLLQ